MSQQYDNNNKATLWKNLKKTEEKQPDYKGSVNVEGVEYWISGWINTAGPQTTRPGEKYIAMRLELKEGQQAKPAPPSQQAAQDPLDDIPF